MSRIGKITRRTFLGVGVVAAGGIAAGYYVYQRPLKNPLLDDLDPGEVAFTPYVKIGKDSGITIIVPRAETGQGVHTTLAALVADELDVDLAQIAVEHGPAGQAYYNSGLLVMNVPFPWFDEGLGARAARVAMGAAAKFISTENTGGSSSTVDAFEKMRLAGAAAREVLKAAAAKRWNIAADRLTTKGGQVVHPDGRVIPYTELAADAGKLELQSVDLRPETQWKILRKPQRRVDLREKVTGAPIFGIDVQLPDMLYGTLLISPRLGAKPQRANTAPALAIKGVRKVVPISTVMGSGFGIIADNTWAAFSGARALEVEWGPAPYPVNDAGIDAEFRAAFKREPDWVKDKEGDVDAAVSRADPKSVIEAEYEVPFLAHAPMEPMNATAQFRDGRLTIWTGTQMPIQDALLAARHLGIDPAAVTVHVTRLGGSFGRRALDPSLFAAALAKEADGRPIKVTWTREEDMTHDFYRPRALARLRAVVQPGKVPESIDATVVAPSVVFQLVRCFPDQMAPPEDALALEGLAHQPMSVANTRFSAHKLVSEIPVGFWRSVGSSYNTFFHESFLDEVAKKSGLDPIEMRIAMMQASEHRPAKLVMEKLREVSNWGSKLPEGHGKGVAFTLAFGSWVGEVVEVDASNPKAVRISKVWCVADPGKVLDPGLYTDQMMSGVIFGLSSALGQKITFEDGSVVQTNFDTFDAMRMHQCPQIEVHLLENANRMGGAGEVGVPAVIPALANAIHAATGKRLRRMPFSEDVTFA